MCSPSADTRVLPACLRLASRLRLGGFPRVAPVEVHPQLATRTGRAPIADFAPRGRMRIVQADEIVQDAVLKKIIRRQTAPSVMVADTTFLHRFEDSVLLERAEGVKAPVVPRLCFDVQRGKTALPRLPHRRQ